MLPDRVSNPGPLTYESGALPIALRGPADTSSKILQGDNKMKTKARRLSLQAHHAPSHKYMVHKYPCKTLKENKHENPVFISGLNKL